MEYGLTREGGGLALAERVERLSVKGVHFLRTKTVLTSASPGTREARLRDETVGGGNGEGTRG